ncbi:uncharacterized protein [Arachis hypogaea]|uniref:uncharacterized protein n=1 Tax=Arachis hypogaea TaxID=3818 RepID=UPI003B21B927
MKPLHVCCFGPPRKSYHRRSCRRQASVSTAEAPAITVVEEAHRSCWRLPPLCLVVLSRAAVPGRRKIPLPSPENSAGAIAGVRSPLLLEVAAGLLLSQFRDRHYFGSAVPSSFELLKLLRKWLGTEVLAAGILIVDLELRRKGFCDAFGLWFCVLRIWTLKSRRVYLVVVEMLCIVLVMVY